MEFSRILDRGHVGHWSLQRGTERDSGRQYTWMVCSICGQTTAPWPLDDAVAPTDHWNAGEEMRAHDDMWHPGLVEEQHAANQEVLRALWPN